MKRNYAGISPDELALLDNDTLARMVSNPAYMPKDLPNVINTAYPPKNPTRKLSSVTGQATDMAGNVVGDVVGEGAEAAIKNKGLKGLFNKQNFGWSKGKGLKAFGKNVGKWGNVAGGVMQGISALSNINQLGNAKDTTADLQNQILNSYNSNPMAGLYMTAEQKKLLRDLKNNGADTSVDLGDFVPNSVGDLVSPLIQGGLGFATGGIPGAIIGGVGGLANAGLENATESQQLRNAELEALLASLEDAEMQYQQLLRSGAQRRFQQFYA
jgi:hypothetical protein